MADKSLMCRFMLLIAVCSLFALLSVADESPTKAFYFLGGAGDPSSQQDTIFDSAYRDMTQFAIGSDWHTVVRYDGGHPVTDQMVNSYRNAIPDQDNFTINTFPSTISRMKTQIGGMAPGSEMLIVLDDHGAARTRGDRSQSSHDVAASETSLAQTDTVSLAGSTTVSLDALKSVISAANQKGIKLAIVDMSCYSGNTLSLANDKTCVISGTSADMPGYSSFGNYFLENMREGRNLESVFLDARKAMDGLPVLPMISTPAGALLSKTENDPLTGFLRYGADMDYSSQAEAASCAACDPPLKRETQLFAGLSGLLRGNAWDQDPDVQNFKSAVQAYRDLQSRIETGLEAQNGPALDTKETIRVNYVNGKGRKDVLSDEVSWRELISGDWSREIENYEDAARRATSRSDRLEEQARVKWANACQDKAQEILQQHPEFLQPSQQILQAADLTATSSKLAQQVAKTERKVYQKAYEQNSDGSPNACKDFVL